MQLIKTLLTLSRFSSTLSKSIHKSLQTQNFADENIVQCQLQAIRGIYRVDKYLFKVKRAIIGSYILVSAILSWRRYLTVAALANFFFQRLDRHTFFLCFLYVYTSKCISVTYIFPYKIMILKSDGGKFTYSQ